MLIDPIDVWTFGSTAAVSGVKAWVTSQAGEKNWEGGVKVAICANKNAGAA